MEQIGAPAITSATDTVSAEAIEAASSISAVSAPAVSTPEVSMPNITAPDVSAPDVSTPDVSVPEASAPAMTMPEIAAAEVTKPSIEPEEPSPNISEPVTPETPAAVSYAPELVAARDEAMERIDQLASIEATDSKRKRALADTYVALAKTGSLFDSANASAGNNVIAKLKEDESLLNELAGATALWLKLAKRPSQGVVVVGELETSGGKTSIRLSNDELVSVIDAGTAITSGKVIGLGKIIDGPDGQSISLPLMESL